MVGRASSPEKRLTPQQEKFALAVVGLGDLTGAYLEVYGSGSSTSRRATTKLASRLASLPHVRRRIEELQKAAAARAGVTHDRVVAELARVALSSVRRVVDADGRLLLPNQLDEDTAAAVASFKIDEYGRIEYKFWNKVDALDKLAKYLGLYERDNAQQPPPVIREIRLVPLQPREGATPAGG